MDYNITYREKDRGIQVIVSYKNNKGEWKQKSKQGFPKKKDAKKAAEKIVDELKKSFQIKLNVELQSLTFGQFKDMYLDHKKLHNEPKTALNYKNAFDKFISLGDIELSKINALHIQQCVDEMVRSNFKSSSIKRHVSNIKTAFNSAVNQYRIIAENPVTGIEIAKDKSTPSDKIKALTKVKRDKLLSAMENRRDYYMISLIAAKCGLRVGEIIGLTWNDIDFVSGTIKVNKQWKFLKNKKWGFGPVKSNNSNRIVPASKSVLKELSSHKKTSPLNIDGRVFSLSNTASVAARLKTLYASLGFDISVHVLRHTYATMLIAAGVDFKTTAALLGHDVEQTIKTYSHLTDDMTARASKVINAIFE